MKILKFCFLDDSVAKWAQGVLPEVFKFVEPIIIALKVPNMCAQQLCFYVISWNTSGYRGNWVQDAVTLLGHFRCLSKVSGCLYRERNKASSSVSASSIICGLRCVVWVAPGNMSCGDFVRAISFAGKILEVPSSWMDEYLTCVCWVQVSTVGEWRVKLP